MRFLLFFSFSVVTEQISADAENARGRSGKVGNKNPDSVVKDRLIEMSCREDVRIQSKSQRMKQSKSTNWSATARAREIQSENFLVN